MLRQLYTLDSYGIDRGRIDFPTLDQRAIICRNFQAAKKIHLARNKGCPPNDSGWFFGCFELPCDHNNASYLQSLSLLDAVSLRPQTANWLALPGEVHVILAPGEKPVVELDGSDLKLTPGSFVDQFSESTSRSPRGIFARLGSWLHQRHS